LTEIIAIEKPDMVVFLDKGARVLATPIEKFLRDKTDYVPKFRFYNDDRLKRSYLSFQSNSMYQYSYFRVVEEDFLPYKDKKVFFIDETYSMGKGAAALSEAIAESGVDGYYFALTRDPESREEEDWDEDEDHRVTYQQIQDAVERLRKQGRLKIYDNDIGYLFTKNAALLYVADKKLGETIPAYELIPGDKVDEEYDYTIKRGKLPNSRAYLTEYAGRDWKEYDKQVRLSNLNTLAKLKQLIFEELNKGI
jgi:hypothetical protein